MSFTSSPELSVRIIEHACEHGRAESETRTSCCGSARLLAVGKHCLNLLQTVVRAASGDLIPTAQGEGVSGRGLPHSRVSLAFLAPPRSKPWSRAELLMMSFFLP